MGVARRAEGNRQTIKASTSCPALVDRCHEKEYDDYEVACIDRYVWPLTTGAISGRCCQATLSGCDVDGDAETRISAARTGQRSMSRLMMRQHGDQNCCSQSPLSRSSFLASSPAFATATQNLRAEFLKERMERKMPERQGFTFVHQQSTALPAVGLATEPCSFAAISGLGEELRTCQGMLDEMTRNVRMDRLDCSKQVSEETRRADERRRTAERERRLREQVREARAPEQRVAARLEQRRWAEETGDMEPKAATRVPMRAHITQGIKGAQRTELVDVSSLQALCIGLAQGGTSGVRVETLCELADQRLRRARSDSRPCRRRGACPAISIV